jgi:hypothetical protein
MSSIIPSSLIVDMSTNWSTVGDSLRLVSHKASMVSHIITLMVSPRSINVLVMSVLLIYTLATGITRLEYLVERTPPIIKSNNLPITWIVGDPPFFCQFLLKKVLILL